MNLEFTINRDSLDLDLALKQMQQKSTQANRSYGSARSKRRKQTARERIQYLIETAEYSELWSFEDHIKNANEILKVKRACSNNFSTWQQIAEDILFKDESHVLKLKRKITEVVIRIRQAFFSHKFSFKRLNFCIVLLSFCLDLRSIFRTKIVDIFKCFSAFSGSEEADAITLFQPVYQFTFNLPKNDKNKYCSYRSTRHCYCQ